MRRFFITNKILLALVLAVAAVSVFSNSLGGEFVYDDNRQIIRNPLVQDPSLYGQALISDVWAFKGDGTVAASNYWRPAYTAWTILNYRLFGNEPFGWHLLNVLLHAGVSVLIFLLLLRWTLPPAESFVIALIFTVHPVHSESVAWISGVPDLLFGLFFLGSVWFASNYSKKEQISDLVLALGLYLFALGSKEIAMLSFPIYWLVFSQPEDARDPKKPAIRSVYATIPFAFASAVFFLMRWSVLGRISRPAESSADPLSAVLSIPSIMLFYIKQLVLPVTLGTNYPIRPVESITVSGFILPAGALLLIMAAAAFLYRRSRIQALGSAFLILPLLPALNITAFKPEQIVHDRYLYLPLLGFLMLTVPAVSELLRKAAPRRSAALVWVIGVGVSAPLAIGTHAYNRTWTNELALWSNAVRIDPGSATSFAQYGSALENTGRYAEALRAFNRSLDIKSNATAYIGRARSNLKRGNIEEAVWDLRTVTEMPPEKINAYTLYQAYEALAISLVSGKQYEKAAAALIYARKQLPIFYAALTSKLAVVAYQQGRKETARTELEAVQEQARSELLPDSKSAIYRLGALYAESGDRAAARRTLGEYLSLTGSFSDKRTLADRKMALRILSSTK